MFRSRLLLTGVAAAALAAPGAAGALSGYPISITLRPASLLAAGAKSGKTVHTCQAGRTHTKATARKAVGDPRKTPVVACEQPPRSQPLVPSLAKTASNAISVYG